MTENSQYLNHNKRAWDTLVRQGNRFSKPAEDFEFRDPLKTVDAIGWLGKSIHGKRLLCLASGGGRQSALYAAAGAIVTVVDLSPAMLELDRQVASERRYEIRTIEASMDRLIALQNSEFDIVIQPVSTCYVPDILSVYREVARVLAVGGLYISQHKQPTSLQVGQLPNDQGYVIAEPYYRQAPLPPVLNTKHRENGTLEFLHRWEQLVGGMCRSGFVIEDLVEPLHAKPQAQPGEFEHRSQFVAPYVRIKARRVGMSSMNQLAPQQEVFESISPKPSSIILPD